MQTVRRSQLQSLQENLSLVCSAVPRRRSQGWTTRAAVFTKREESGALKGVIFFPSYLYLSEMRQDKIIHALCPKSGKWML